MREIPREEWAEFLDSFSRQHEGWLVTVEVLGEEIGAQVEAEGKPLGGITAELKDNGEDLISIIVGLTPAESVTHNITAPTHVRIQQAENGADMALQIESSDGATTLVRLRSAMLPEMVDGVVLD
ncbi:MAG TPA: DUF5335 family protein [Pyrinomonadaceae bacterium]|jgi:hypothetical protein